MNREPEWLEPRRSQGRGAWGLLGNNKDFGFYTEGNENPVEGFEQRKDNVWLTFSRIHWSCCVDSGWKGHENTRRTVRRRLSQ